MSPPAPAEALVAAGLRRRLAALVYEGVLLFGVVMAAALVYSPLAQQRHALQGTLGLQIVVFAVVGLYFIWFWTHTGQTLAMQTWHIRLVTRDGGRVGLLRALCRYLLAWLWFLPALLTLHFTGQRGVGSTSGVLLAGMLAYAALARLHPDRQYWHDAVCGTRLVSWKPPPRKA